MQRLRPLPLTLLAAIAAIAAVTVAAAACTNDYGGLRFPRDQVDGGDGLPADAAPPDAR